MTQEAQSFQNQVKEAYKGSFMQPEIKQAKCFVVDGDQGGIFVDSVDIRGVSDIEGVVDVEDIDFEDQKIFESTYEDHFVGGSFIYSVEVREGFMYRLSASGYMDCTDWSFAKTEEEALQELLNMSE